MLKRARGLKSLVHDAVELTVDLVEDGHESAARMVMRVLNAIPPVAAPAQLVDTLRRASTSRVLGSIRAVNRGVKYLTDAGIDAAVAARLLALASAPLPSPVPMRSDIVGAAAWLSDAAVGALNGVVGDYLHREENGLDLGFSLRHGEGYIALDSPLPIALRPAPPTRRIAVFVHGLATTEWSWCLDAAAYHGDPAASFGTLLERDLGVTPLFARYNTGRRVFENGRLLARGLERLFGGDASPIDEIILVGHSMGGLVVRSACHHASEEGHAWVRRVSRVFCLGSPHQGAPLEKLGHLLTKTLGGVDHPGTRIPAAILRRRSAGIRDLRHGTIVDDDDDDDDDDGAWPDPDAARAPGEREAPLLDDVAYYFISATVTRDPAHPLGRLLGDVLVRVPSASGPAVRSDKFRIETRCYSGVMHHQIQCHPDVYARLRRACSGE
jgi:pimeloyl-ACP methyl ester carboxylesterase